ncbi:hypothetical protein N0V95_007125 [Ascochyta clinopodiicola]|nr:hypothetical protein N0V95_007125 [Ascochyta clinopodiicola]
MGAVISRKPMFAAPTMSAASMSMETQPRKRKAPTLRADAWEPYKSRILELHITQKRPLAEVKEMIKQEYQFVPEYVIPLRTKQSEFIGGADRLGHRLRQYRTRISQWKQDKNVKPQEMQAIVRKRQRRKLLEPNKRELVFQSHFGNM